MVTNSRSHSRKAHVASPSIADGEAEVRANASALAEATPRDDSSSPSFMGGTQEEFTMSMANMFVSGETYPEFLPQRHSGEARSGSGSRRVNNKMSFARRISSWIERVRQRQALAGLDDHQLRDIGITRAEAARECEKPFWR